MLGGERAGGGLTLLPKKERNGGVEGEGPSIATKNREKQYFTCSVKKKKMKKKRREETRRGGHDLGKLGGDAVKEPLGKKKT